MRKFIALAIIVLLATTPAMAAGYIGSRDFGSDDAELLMMLAQSELGDASATDKAGLMYDVLAQVWETGNGIEETIMNGNYGSVKSGKFYTSVPDKESEQAVEMIYSGWNKPIDPTISCIVSTLEFWVPMLFIAFLALLFMMISMSLTNLQERMLNRMREHNMRRR